MLDFYCSRVRNKPTYILFKTLIQLFVLLQLTTTSTRVVGQSLTALPHQGDHDVTVGNLHTGPVVQVNTPQNIDLKTLADQNSSGLRPVNLATGAAKRLKPAVNGRPASSSLASNDKSKGQDKKHGEILSTDCLAKRTEILQKLQNSQYTNNKLTHRVPNAHPIPTGFQRLKLKSESLPSGPINGTKDEENEYVPQCTSTGRYEPIQCHKIGYCWCVNKYGQAIKNSAAKADQKLDCDSRVYDSEGDDFLVVTGVSTNRLKTLLKGGGLSGSSSANPGTSHETSTTVTNLSTGYYDAPASENDQTGRGSGKEPLDSEFSRKVSESPEPSLSLVPNECAMSRENAKQRAKKLLDDGIWVPDCDESNEKLYAGMQCHKSKVCWCVDQVTGLPLRTSEQLTMHAPINCTEVRGIVDTATVMFNHESSTLSKQQPQSQQEQQHPATSTFSGFSDSCGLHMRIEFVTSLLDQFRHQLTEYSRYNTNIEPPEALSSSNPYRLNEVQVARWMFSAMDWNHNDKLEDREWSRFKNNFRLVDSLDNIQDLYKPQASHTPLSLNPLGILRNHRRCWRDFLQYCGNGDLLTDELISLPKWLSCTQLPSEHKQMSATNDDKRNDDLDMSKERAYAMSRAAAIARSKKKNPFLGILKPN